MPELPRTRGATYDPGPNPVEVVLFGGGYEVATFFQEKYQKLESTYLFWHAESDDGKKMKMFPISLMRQYYDRDVLVIRSANFVQRHGVSTLRVGDMGFYVIAPVYRNVADEELALGIALRPFKSQRTCHVIMLHVAGRYRSMFVRHDWRPTEPNSPPVDIVEPDLTSVYVVVSPSFIESARRSLIPEVRKLLETP